MAVTSHHRLILWSVLAALVLLGLLQTGPGRSLLTAAGLSPAPSRYLELYFTNPGGHPSDLGQQGGLVRVAFTVRSHDLAADDQGWAVTVSDGSGERTAATGMVSIAPGEHVSVATDVVVPCAESTAGSRSSVAVSLDDTKQRILFWMNCPATTGPAATASPSAP